MSTVLILDASARPGLGGLQPHGSYSRRLTHGFLQHWRAVRPDDTVIHRDVGLHPPRPVSQGWIEAAFTPVAARTSAMREVLAESDALAAELLAADYLVIGSPLYNFGMPAGLKAWIDNVVRAGLTVDIDPERGDEPYVPLLAGRGVRAALLVARGGHGFDPGGPNAHMNHLEPSLRTALGFIGIEDVSTVAVEYQELGGAPLEASLARALEAVDALVRNWAVQAECVA